MSLSKPTWNHFGSHQPFPEKQNLANLYRDALSSSILTPAFSLSAFSPFTMNALSPDEMERFQRLSNNYQPDVQGPHVSTKQPSHNIALDYSNADPTLAAKTNALALSHPECRIMRGDGNCGWRAVAFGYFETLFALRDPIRIQAELSRMKSLNGLMDQMGIGNHIYEIFVDETESILKQILDAIQGGVQDESFLVGAFNEGYTADAIVTHFRMLTSAWMKLNPGRYQAFLHLPVDRYCASRVDTVKTEIDEVGLQALIDGVIEGSGFGVEILYLDRSEGDVVTPHQLSSNCPNGATIRLLYRPGHYDILYQADSALNMAPIVNLQYGLSSDYTTSWDNATLGFDMNSSLMAIPNLMQDSSFGMGAPMSPMPSASPAPPSPFRMSPQQDMYQSPMQSHAPISLPVSPPHPPPTATLLRPATHDIVAQSNLRRSADSTESPRDETKPKSLAASHPTIKPTSKIPTSNPFTGNRTEDDLLR
ncbi:Ovarian tumor otubain [Penicillium brevicompactum]|uniref:Ovarian tumor otubain n=1 Tax=Penicillium brevicompactum TaxID=5074 RepID=UPI002541548C|nr:Ovarian tumor otubain [Penicillium brevicompactum]KAJ5336529.1 Ovarian tumor otubain [Penicillium brevicompactum]